MRKIIVLSLLFIISGCLNKVCDTHKQDINDHDRTPAKYENSNPFSNEIYIWENWEHSSIKIRVK